MCTRCGNGTCEDKVGENICNCPNDCATACKDQTDCKPHGLACEDTSQGCVQYGAGCAQGKCLPAKAPPQRQLICNKTRGDCTRRCSRDLDCLGRSYICQDSAQGCYNVSAKCLSGYCSFGVGKPTAGTVCNRQTMQCVAKGSLCQKDNDCFPDGKITYTCTPHPQGGCNNITKKCYKGQCITSSGRAAGYLCNPVTKQCAKQLCKKDCDCPQGQGCVQGACKTTSPRTYCCSKAACPMGAKCSTTASQSSTCPTPSSCKETRDCGPSHCKNTDAKTCQEFLPTCTQGACKLQAARTVDLSQCDHATGRCKALSCKVTGDCGKSTCKNTNSECLQETPSCANKACSLKKSRFPRSLAFCDAAKGICRSNTRCDRHSKCTKMACSMEDWQVCVQHRQVCNFFINFCAVDTGRHTVEVRSCDTNTGACKSTTCQNSSTCPRKCSTEPGFCVQQSSVCSFGKCVFVKTRKYDSSISTCNQATGSCICNNPGKACHPPECRMVTLGGKPYCRQTTFVCTNGSCVKTKRGRWDFTDYGPNTHTCSRGLCKKR